MQVITDPQFNYLKGLIRKVGKKFYWQARSEFGISPDLSERQLSKKQAGQLIGQLKAEGDSRKPVPVYGDGFEIKTSYSTTMFVETDEVLITWAKKRFKKEVLSLKKIKEFLEDKERVTIAVPGYKIERRKQ